MTVKEFLVVFTNFLEKNLSPGLNESFGSYSSWIMGGIMAGLSRGVVNKINENADVLKMLGMLNSDGTVSIDGIEEFLEGAFEKSPELRIDPKSILGLKFDNPLVNNILDGEMVFRPEEAKEFISMLRSR